MCLRYVAALSAPTLTKIFDASINLHTSIEPNWNIAPRQYAPVIRRTPRGERQIDLLSWGLMPGWSGASQRVPGPFNTLSVASCGSAMFSGLLAERRCLVPAEAYYAWRADSADDRPQALARRDGEPMAFAGLWDVWWNADGNLNRSFTIITTSAEPRMAQFGAQMPVILDPQDWQRWLDPVASETGSDPMGLLHQPAQDVLEVWPVSRAVNTIGNNGPALLDAVSQTATSRTRFELAC